MKRGHLIVIAGPAAVGKGTVVSRIRELLPNIHLSVSATTRSPRPGEVDGEHYHFVSNEKFDSLVSGNEMLEWALVHGLNRYGTPRKPILEALDNGQDIILEIDVQGAKQIKTKLPEAILIFLLPPSWEELVRRLSGRGTENDAEQARRLATAKEEYAAREDFDFQIVNQNVNDAAEAVVNLLSEARNRKA